MKLALTKDQLDVVINAVFGVIEAREGPFLRAVTAQIQDLVILNDAAILAAVNAALAKF